MKPAFFPIVLLAYACPFILQAQPGDTVNVYDLSLEELSELAVYATDRVSAQRLKEAPANVRIVTSNQIEERGYQSLIDLLEDLPGFKIDRAVDPRWQNDVTLRGIRYLDKIILLLDGIRISSPTNEIISFFENYPLYMTKQVEIIYGPSSALYGADAFAGTINIVTGETHEKKTTAYAQLNTGMYASISSSFSVSTRLSEKASLAIGGNYFEDEQPDLARFYPNTYAGRDEALASGVFNTIFGVREVLTPVDPEKGYPLDAYSFYTKFRYGNFSLISFGNHSHSPSSTANDPNNSVYNRAQVFGHNVRKITGRYEKVLGNLKVVSLVTNSAYQLDKNSNFRNAITGMEPAYLFSRSRKLKLEQLATYVLSEELTVTGGITHEWFNAQPRNNNLEQPVDTEAEVRNAIIAGSRTPFNPDGIAAELVSSTYQNTGALAQANYVTQKLGLTLGVRLDKDTRYNATINPRFGMTVKPTESLNLKFLVGSAYLAPSPQNIYDRYGKFIENPDVPGTYKAILFQLPNETLQPQRIVTPELYADYLLNDKVRFSASAYLSRVSNEIQPVNSGTNPKLVNELYPGNRYEIDGWVIPIDSIQINANLGTSTIFGSNLGIDYLWKTSRKWSGSFSLNYSFIDGTVDIDEDGPAVKRNLKGVAPSMLKLMGTIRKNRFTSTLSVSMFSRQRTFGINAMMDSNNDGNPFNDKEYQEIAGYFLANFFMKYGITKWGDVTLSIKNLTDSRYRHVNIGANPEQADNGGSAQIELNRGAPQNPFRLIVGFAFKI